MATLNRYLIRRSTGDVWAWAEGIAKRNDVEEVWAEDAVQAKLKEALPNVGNVSMDQLDKMGKQDLMVFAKVRMGMELDPTQTKAVMVDLIKAAIFSRPEESHEAAPMVTRSFANAGDIRSSGAAGHGGDKATVATKATEAKAKENARDNSDPVGGSRVQ